uniref:Ferric-chelate reductase (NADH) n=1 Tax=Opuntia streptacantha TaxID=393608 RepID=A0A7C9APM8_OPUST
MGKTMFLLLRILMIITFSAWIVLWFLKPTNGWTRKWKEFEDNMQRIIFKYNGADFLVFTFPIIGLAMLGLVYTNLQPKRASRSRVRRYAAALSNPLIIRTPLGILSGIEALAMCLLLTLLGWTFYCRISNDYKKLIPAKPLKLTIWQLKFLKIATRCGLLAEICLALLLFPILRGLSILRLLGIQFEASVRYHIWLGTSMVFLATLHGAGTLFVWGISPYIQNEMRMWQKQGRIYLAGEITLITGLIIWMSSLPVVRRKRFYVFYYMHHLYIVFLVFFLFHAGDRHFYMVFPGAFLFGLDKLFRIIQSRPLTQILSVRIFPSKVIELDLPKDSRLKYSPTSILFIKIPTISKFHWHPFSITSSSNANDQTISVMIKCEGQWTNSLYDLLHQEIDSPHRTKCIDVAVEGPYGPASFDFIRYDGLLLIGGGIGITPILSILQEIASSSRSGLQMRFPSEIQLIYVTKKSQDISLLSSMSNLVLDHSSKFCNLKMRVFVTQEAKGSAGVGMTELLREFSTMQTIPFEPKTSSYILGPENPLWMASITGFASVVFLACLCFFNHFLFPAGKKPSKQRVPSTIVDVFLLCSFLIALGCAAIVAIVVRWRNSREAIPSTRDKGDQGEEFGSMEQTSTLKEHEIHYGARPDFSGTHFL